MSTPIMLLSGLTPNKIQPPLPLANAAAVSMASSCNVKDFLNSSVSLSPSSISFLISLASISCSYFVYDILFEIIDQQVPQLVALGLEIALIGGVGWHLNGDALHHLHPIT